MASKQNLKGSPPRLDLHGSYTYGGIDSVTGRTTKRIMANVERTKRLKKDIMYNVTK